MGWPVMWLLDLGLVVWLAMEQEGGCWRWCCSRNSDAGVMVGVENGCSVGARGTDVVHATGVDGNSNRLKDGVAAGDTAAGCW